MSGAFARRRPRIFQNISNGDVCRAAPGWGLDPRKQIVDRGIGQTVWTTGNENTSRQRIYPNSSNSYANERTGRLGHYVWYFEAGSDFMQGAYSAANAISAGDFFIGIWYFPGTTVLTSKGSGTYVVGVQDATPTAAGTAWALFHGNTGDFYLVVSDGTTRQLLGPYTAAVVANQWNYLAAERVSGSVKLSNNGTVGATIAYSTALNIPTGQAIRMGQAVFGAAPTYAESTWNSFQLMRRAPHGGASFVAPSVPYCRFQ